MGVFETRRNRSSDSRTWRLRSCRYRKWRHKIRGRKVGKKGRWEGGKERKREKEEERETKPRNRKKEG